MTISDNLLTIGERLRSAEQRYQRPMGSVRLLAVSKHQPITAIQTALAAGQRAFGENYAQEMHEKAQQIAAHYPNTPIEWHFIGPLQSNKSRWIAETAHWVHSLDRIKIAQRLSEQKPSNKPALNVCLQVNISRESSKSGVMPEALTTLAQAVAQLPGLTLRGLMAIPEPCNDFTQQRQRFAQLAHLQQTLNQQGFALDTLSMGMSDDMEAAIAEGATWVRIGTAIFGARTY